MILKICLDCLQCLVSSMFTAVSRLLILPIRETRSKATYLYSTAHRVLVPCGAALLGVTCTGADSGLGWGQ